MRVRGEGLVRRRAGGSSATHLNIMSATCSGIACANTAMSENAATKRRDVRRRCDVSSSLMSSRNIKYSKNVPKSFSCRSQSIKIFKLQSWRKRRCPWTLGTEKAQHFQETQHKEQLLGAKQQFHSEKCFLSKCHELARAQRERSCVGDAER